MNKKLTLFVSDLDNTLLQSNAQLSPFAISNINNMIEKGVLFTIASARSVKSIQPLFKDVHLKLPVIEFNGSFISDLETGAHQIVNSLDDSAKKYIINTLNEKGINYFLSTFDSFEDKLYYSKTANFGEEWYVNDRKKANDSRLNYTDHIYNHINEDVVCFTVIDKKEKLIGLQKKFLLSNINIEIHLQENSYSPGWYWLSVHSHKACKDLAIKNLLEMYNLNDADVIAFGDNTNDIKMLKNATKGIAVENALVELKEVADQTIGLNDHDSVIKYIAEFCNIELIGTRLD